MMKNMKDKENKECTPIEAMSHAQSAMSPEALSRLRMEKEKQIEYYYFDPRTDMLSLIPATVDRIDLGPRRKSEYLVKTKNGTVTEIRPFRDEYALSPEKKKSLTDQIKKNLGRQSMKK